MPPFDSADLLKIAQQCLHMSPSEAALRSAINRAYYAAFRIARDYCHVPLSVDGTGSHDAVLNAVDRLDFPDAYDRARRLRYLKRQRVRADYGVIFTELEAIAVEAVDDAELIVQWFRRLPART